MLFFDLLYVISAVIISIIRATVATKIIIEPVIISGSINLQKASYIKYKLIVINKVILIRAAITSAL